MAEVPLTLFWESAGRTPQQEAAACCAKGQPTHRVDAKQFESHNTVALCEFLQLMRGPLGGEIDVCDGTVAVPELDKPVTLLQLALIAFSPARLMWGWREPKYVNHSLIVELLHRGANALLAPPMPCAVFHTLRDRIAAVFGGLLPPSPALTSTASRALQPVPVALPLLHADAPLEDIATRRRVLESIRLALQRLAQLQWAAGSQATQQQPEVPPTTAAETYDEPASPMRPPAPGPPLGDDDEVAEQVGMPEIVGSDRVFPPVVVPQVLIQAAESVAAVQPSPRCMQDCLLDAMALRRNVIGDSKCPSDEENSTDWIEQIPTPRATPPPAPPADVHRRAGRLGRSPPSAMPEAETLT